MRSVFLAAALLCASCSAPPPAAEAAPPPAPTPAAPAAATPAAEPSSEGSGILGRVSALRRKCPDLACAQAVVSAVRDARVAPALIDERVQTCTAVCDGTLPASAFVPFPPATTSTTSPTSPTSTTSTTSTSTSTPSSPLASLALLQQQCPDLPCVTVVRALSERAQPPEPLRAAVDACWERCTTRQAGQKETR